MKKAIIRRIHLFTGILLCFVFVCCAVTSAVYAGSYYDAELNVSQSFTFSDTLLSPPNDVFTYALEGATGKEPLPIGAENGVYSFVLKGNAALSFGLFFDNTETSSTGICFTKAGEYDYKLHQIIPKSKGNYIYDKQVYQIRIAVLNEGNGLCFGWLEIYDDNNLKPDTIEFKNSYIEPDQTDKLSEKPNMSSTEASASRKTTNTDTPKTGDESRLGMWLGLMAASGCCLAVTAILFRRRKRQSK